MAHALCLRMDGPNADDVLLLLREFFQHHGGFSLDLLDDGVTSTPGVKGLSARGQLDEALRIRTEDQLPVYERLGDVRSLAATLNSLFDLYWEKEEFQQAYESITKAFEIFTQLGIPDGIGVVGQKLGQVLIAAQQTDEAYAVLQQSREAFATLGFVDRVQDIDALITAHCGGHDEPA